METIIVDKNIYPLKALFSVAYIFLEDFYIFLEENESGKILVRIKGKDAGQDVKKAVDEFKNELINAGLRLKISEDNKKIREMIVSAALYGRVCRRDEGLND
ncbi:MAG: His-Xaa-Ser system protein HxsD [Candidatus ainarchaeum sp.]|nr:His-Xaa-Ser system protein HxsD [Candidatus ainarchaeum sp.]